MSIMQRLYDSEINTTVSSFYDDGSYVKLARRRDERLSSRGTLRTWADVEEWLAAMARIHYPTSAFTRGNDRLPTARSMLPQSFLCVLVIGYEGGCEPDVVEVP